MNAYELADELQIMGENNIFPELANMLRQLAKQKDFLQNQSSELAKEVMYFQEQNRQQAERIAELEKGLELIKDAYCERDSKCRQLKAQTKPLSDEEIFELYKDCKSNHYIDFARAIEAKVRGQ